MSSFFARTVPLPYMSHLFTRIRMTNTTTLNMIVTKIWTQWLYIRNQCVRFENIWHTWTSSLRTAKDSNTSSLINWMFYFIRQWQRLPKCKNLMRARKHTTHTTHTHTQLFIYLRMTLFSDSQKGIKKYFKKTKYYSL